MAVGSFRLRPLGVGDLLDETIQLYRRHYALFIAIAAWVFVPLGIVQLLQQLVLLGTRDLVLSGLVALLPAPILWVGSFAMGLAMTYAVSEVYLGHDPAVGRAYSRGFRRFWGALGLSILVGLALILLSITILGIPVAIYFGVGWSLAIPVLLLEGADIGKAMGRSRSLVKGSWWRILGILVLLGVIMWVVQFAFSFVAGLFGALLPRESIGSSVVTVLASTVGELVSAPIWTAGIVLLYYDLRVRKEGFDLELLAQAMRGGGPEGGGPQAALE